MVRDHANFVYQPVSAELTHSLRQSVLRPHQRLDEMHYEGDDLPESIHLGGFDTLAPSVDQPIGVLSLYLAPMPGDGQPADYRLRGMAVEPGDQRRGVGAALIRASMAEVAQRGGARIWCNARESATAFYTALGFAMHGDPFEIAGIGPHLLMSIAVIPKPR